LQKRLFPKRLFPKRLFPTLFPNLGPTFGEKSIGKKSLWGRVGGEKSFGKKSFLGKVVWGTGVVPPRRNLGTPWCNNFPTSNLTNYTHRKYMYIHKLK
jgi:hypothetical protein